MDAGAKRAKARITWDEPTIAEHDKLRGTRMKIDEPDTPYAYNEYNQAATAQKDNVGRGEILERAVGADGSEGLHPAAAIGATAPPTQCAGKAVVNKDVGGAMSGASAFGDAFRSRLENISADPESRRLTQHDDPDAKQRAAFRAKRSAHYNEFQRMQEFKRRLAAGELTDDEDGEDAGADAEADGGAKLVL
jgi:protein phosphatase inhibitor 2